MPGDILLGIDVGTTELKVAAFDAASGRTLSAAAHRLGVRTDAHGMREQDPGEILRLLCQMFQRMSSDVGRSWRRVAGVGLTSQGGSAILCDRRTGQALTSMQLWNDTRSVPLLRDIASRRPGGYWRRLARLPQPGAGLARIEWLRRRYPGLVPCGGNSSPRTIYAGAGEYVLFALTGTWLQDPGNAIQVGCYSVPHRALVADPLGAVGVGLDFVAPLRQGHPTHAISQAGAQRLGLPEGIPVAGPYIDHEAGYLSAVGTGGKPLQCSLGTAWVGNFVARELPLPPRTGLDLVLPSPVESGSLVLRVMLAGNATWNWALDTFVSPKRDVAFARADAIFTERLLPPRGLVSLPWFTQPNAWDGDSCGNGGFVGLGAAATSADMLRAVAAGMAFEFAGMFTSLRKNRQIDRVVLGGGASKCRAFTRLLASLLEPLPVYAANEEHLVGARGSVYAFNPQAAHGATRRVQLSGAKIRQEILASFELYDRVKKRLVPMKDCLP